MKNRPDRREWGPAEESRQLIAPVGDQRGGSPEWADKGVSAEIILAPGLWRLYDA